MSKQITFSRGFTLIELLVVLVLLGLVAGIAYTGLGAGNQERELLNEAKRLHAVLRMASDEAIYANTEIGLALTEDKYQFVTYSEEDRAWQPSSVSVLRSHNFPEWLQVEFQRLDKDTERLFESTQEQDTEEESVEPDLMLFSSGEVTPFVISFEVDSNSDYRVEIALNEKNEIVLRSEGDD